MIYTTVTCSSFWKLWPPVVRNGLRKRVCIMVVSCLVWLVTTDGYTE